MQCFLHVLIVSLCSQAVAGYGMSDDRLVRTSRVAMSVSSSGQAEEEKATMRAGAQYLLNDVEDMARAGDVPKSDKLGEIKSIVTTKLIPDLEEDHKYAVDQIAKNLEAIKTCNKNAATTLNNIKTSTEVTVGEKRTKHATCREAEKEKNTTKGSRCYELDTFLDAISVPADLPAGRPRAQMVQYVETMSTYFCPKGPEVTTLDDACTKASSEHATHKAGCDKDQATFELGFCTWKTQLNDACSAQTTCYDGAVNVHNLYVTGTKELVKKWKIEYASLKKILCYVEVWLNDNNANTADKNQLNSCNGSYIDTSPMDIAYPEVPAKATCDMTKVKEYPGTPGFVTAEYSNFLDHANDVIPCLEDVTPTVNTANEAPAPTEPAAVTDIKWELFASEDCSGTPISTVSAPSDTDLTSCHKWQGIDHGHALDVWIKVTCLAGGIRKEIWAMGENCENANEALNEWQIDASNFDKEQAGQCFAAAVSKVGTPMKSMKIADAQSLTFPDCAASLSQTSARKVISTGIKKTSAFGLF